MKPQGAALPAFPSRGLSLVHVVEVFSCRGGDYRITADTIAAPTRRVVYTTADVRKVATVVVAKEEQLPLEVEWRRSRFGLDLVSAKLAVTR